MVRFDKQWFNPLYFILNEIKKDDSIRIVLVYGGKSSAKTASICQFLIKEAVCYGYNSIAFRKESSTIPTTLKKSFNLARDTTRLFPAIDTQERRFLCDVQDQAKTSEIVLKGIDSEEKAKGVESYKYLFLDELNHFDEAEYDQFNMSLRGIPGQKIFAAWNPVDENSWVKTNLVDKYNFVDTDLKLPSSSSWAKRSDCGRVILIRTVYQDNYWITGSPCGTYGYRDENLISVYEEMRTKDYNKYKVNVLGEWGKVEYGGEILKKWKSELHIKKHPYDPELAVYLSWDENVNPYLPCGIFQVAKDNKSLMMIHIITAKNPNNTLKWVCQEIGRKLNAWQHKGRLFVTGDATSQKEDVKMEKGHDMFRIIMSELKEWKPTRIVPTANPSVVLSTDFFNSILADNIFGISYTVDESCRAAIMDYENTKEDKNGKVDKKTVTDAVTKVSYQPYGHIYDLTRYALCTIFANEYGKHKQGSFGGGMKSGKATAKNAY